MRRGVFQFLHFDQGVFFSAGLLTQTAKNCTSKISLTAGGKSADAKRLFALMSLGVKKGDKIVFQIEGEDEESESKQIGDFCKRNL